METYNTMTATLAVWDSPRAVKPTLKKEILIEKPRPKSNRKKQRYVPLRIETQQLSDDEGDEEVTSPTVTSPFSPIIPKFDPPPVAASELYRLWLEVRLDHFVNQPSAYPYVLRCSYLPALRAQSLSLR